MELTSIQCSKEVKKVLSDKKKADKTPMVVYLNQIFIKAGLLNKDGSVK